ncbi:MAG: SCO family protein [Bacteroidota bacterium]|nr:SCO family protein [Bacteroidota bacterium]
MNRKRLLLYGGFFIGLVILFFLFAFWGTDNWKTKLPLLTASVQPFSFITQNNTTFTRKDMLGKVCVVNYFFTSCKGICPRMNGNLKKVYDEFKNEPDFLIVSHTSDPETDSASRLKAYAQKMNVDTGKWIFLTGRKDSLYKQARDSYLLDDPKNAVVNMNDQFLHTQFVALVDKNGHLRGQIYDGLKQNDLQQLQTDIAILLKEKTTNFSGSNFSHAAN